MWFLFHVDEVECIMLLVTLLVLPHCVGWLTCSYLHGFHMFIGGFLGFLIGWFGFWLVGFGLFVFWICFRIMSVLFQQYMKYM